MDPTLFFVVLSFIVAVFIGTLLGILFAINIIYHFGAIEGVNYLHDNKHRYIRGGAILFILQLLILVMIILFKYYAP